MSKEHPVAAALERLGLSYEQLAELVAVHDREYSPSYLRQIGSGHRQPSLRLARALELSLRGVTMMGLAEWRPRRRAKRVALRQHPARLRISQTRLRTPPQRAP